MKKKMLLLVILSIIFISFAYSMEKGADYLENQTEIKASFDFSLSYEDAKEIIVKLYPDLKTDDEILQFIEDKKIQKREVDGEIFYYADLENNLYFRDIELIKQKDGWGEGYRIFVESFFKDYYHEKLEGTDFYTNLSPYFNGRKYLVEYSINVGENELPDRGHLKLWISLPLQTAFQENIDIIKAEPFGAIVGYPKTTGDIAYIHYDFDLEKYSEIDISIMYTFMHYQQEFTVNLDNIGEYDKDGWLYKEYTASSKNIFYNDEIKSLALSIVDGETNPYLMAEKIYYYVVNNIFYSHIAHSYLEAENIPESLAVFENGFGDCGAQSMFFSALCRSVGIPSRAAGGFQIFFNNLGDHFWAEFYLPNYGWLPVDTSVGQVAKYTYWLDEDRRNKFIDFYFGNQDPLRMVIQNDVDKNPEEIPEDVQFLSMVMQLPFVDCDFENENLDVSLEIIMNTNMKTYFLK